MCWSIGWSFGPVNQPTKLIDQFRLSLRLQQIPVRTSVSFGWIGIRIYFPFDFDFFDSILHSFILLLVIFEIRQLKLLLVLPNINYYNLAQHKAPCVRPSDSDYCSASKPRISNEVCRCLLWGAWDKLDVVPFGWEPRPLASRNNFGAWRHHKVWLW